MVPKLKCDPLNINLVVYSWWYIRQSLIILVWRMFFLLSTHFSISHPFENCSVVYLWEEGTIQLEAIESSRLALQQRRICGALHHENSMCAQ